MQISWAVLNISRIYQVSELLLIPDPGCGETIPTKEDLQSCRSVVQKKDNVKPGSRNFCKIT